MHSYIFIISFACIALLVLILVLMEDALVPGEAAGDNSLSAVLILVLMEDALVRGNSVRYGRLWCRS